MPLIQVKTSTAAPATPDVQAMLKNLSAKLAQHTGKPESYVMTAFEAEVPMTFAGTTEPACYVEIKSIGKMKPEQTQAMSQDFCTTLNQSLGVPTNRIYIEFADAQGYMWGWNGSTF
ncbi:phenylpyruvate tautomerase MIF-related protein [Calothrix sp. NIES-3974]|uniref:phenylpyruvate tautomerase MIF-related protein n=1 Tax=Calothrix sp. NIES-3974 TaxID=2005462 RepID=UPI000B6213BF|nr:phenylpyruvate tautomerase MIF-related protein [Calothrix sp. NIES-3974]BAZ03744.1 macrophage migration inhibitory factor family protein [Calothrix sp. NIES-3974]